MSRTRLMVQFSSVLVWFGPRFCPVLMTRLSSTKFHDLILRYTKKGQPLQDLLQKVEMPGKHTKMIYRRVMSNYKLKEHWIEDHTKAFLALKAAMTLGLVLKGPKWDGTPFIVTTDG